MLTLPALAALALAAAPLADHHLHLLSPAARQLMAAAQGQPAPPAESGATAATLIEAMDGASVRRGVIHGVGYFFATPMLPRPFPDEAARVSAENDWAAAQAARFPARLVAYCGVNPLKDHALAELKRCSRLRSVRGMKLHFANSRIDLKNPDHRSRVRAFFAAANSARMPIAVHLWNGPAYGRADSEIFLADIMPAAPSIIVQVMHLAGAGPGYGPDAALAPFAEAAARRDPVMRHIYFDTAAINERTPPETLALIATRLRQIGLGKILFGTDYDGAHNAAPRAAWASFRKLPLTAREFDRIAANRAPYLR